MHIFILIIVGLFYSGAIFSIGTAYGHKWEQQGVTDLIAFREKLGHEAETIIDSIKARLA